jgi:glutaminyl-tRNA synthetase
MKEPGSVTDPHPPSTIPADSARSVPPNFVTDVVDADLTSGRVTHVVTRFPPEPNGYLHIGHAKAICLDFGVAHDYQGRVYLRMDDTNPTTEDPEYVQAIQDDIAWLGFRWHELRYASDYFERLYRLAVTLVERGLAYVDSQSEEAIRAGRGTLTEPGEPSSYRERSVAENLELFRRMRAGEFADGEHVLRAKIDMASTTIVLRDPVLYRIKHAHHYRSGDTWPIYPLYDFAHPLSDAIEGITHSLCSLEFENNRAVYDWLVERSFPEPRPRQYEFARLALDHTVLSKRKLVALVQGGFVTGWDDPRMPTLAALRRRGVPPEAVRAFVTRVGVTRSPSRTSPALLEESVRDALNLVAPRVMAVLDPVPLELTGLAPDVYELHAPRFPDDPDSLQRRVPISPRLLIERDDVALDPPAGFKRLAPGRAVRLRHAFVIRCDEVVTDADGRLERVRATVLPGTLGANPAGVRVWSTIHWVDAEAGAEAEFRLYDHLFSVPDPDAAGGEFTDHLAPDSRVVRRGVIEPSVLRDPPDARYQFERLGYFWRDPVDGRDERLVFNRIVALKDGWAKRRAPAPPREGSEAADADPAKVTAGSDPANVATVPDGLREPPAGVDPLGRLGDADRAHAERLRDRHGLEPGQAALIAASPDFGRLFDEGLTAGAPAPDLAAWITNDVQRLSKSRGGVPPALRGQALATLLRLVREGGLTVRLAREALDVVAESGADPEAVVRERGLTVQSDPAAMAALVRQVLADHPDELAAYRAGKGALRGFFVGQVMRASRGRADPAAVHAAVTTALDEHTT